MFPTTKRMIVVLAVCVIYGCAVVGLAIPIMDWAESVSIDIKSEYGDYLQQANVTDTDLHDSLDYAVMGYSALPLLVGVVLVLAAYVLCTYLLFRLGDSYFDAIHPPQRLRIIPDKRLLAAFRICQTLEKNPHAAKTLLWLCDRKEHPFWQPDLKATTCHYHKRYAVDLPLLVSLQCAEHGLVNVGDSNQEKVRATPQGRKVAKILRELQDSNECKKCQRS